ncbi:unnamed protein product [Cylindrotheca closterium]|uniref:Core domain-containing protein n=1 Tax=Cylindrotheca closterium TaxID=2856 RepID=A0AAD2FFM0_9STRA|nr:unnamed protein product [Cylindrotheca closterium]
MTSSAIRIGSIVSRRAAAHTQNQKFLGFSPVASERLFSSAAVAQKPRRRITEKKDPIEVVGSAKAASFYSETLGPSLTHVVFFFPFVRVNCEYYFNRKTERAAERIKGILSGDNAAGALGIRLGVKRRGCNGLSYTLNYAFEQPEKDVEMEAHGIKVYIEPMALFSVVGTTMDWEETELASEFTFHNPNSKGECGCGESFTV